MWYASFLALPHAYLTSLQFRDQANPGYIYASLRVPRQYVTWFIALLVILAVLGQLLCIYAVRYLELVREYYIYWGNCYEVIE